MCFIASGCGDSQRAKPARPGTRDAEGATPAPAHTTNVAPTASAPAPSRTSDAAEFHPLALDDFYQRLFGDYKPAESWAQVPCGTTNFEGVPFRLFGKLDLTGLGRARDGEFQPARVGEVPVNRRAARLHLMHGATYDAPDNTPVACVLLRYDNGEARRLFIRYGVHVRNWHVERNETNPTLSDPRSRVVWTGTTGPDGSGTPTRLFLTTFDNPRPAQQIRNLELLSLFARANSVILAITLEDSPGAPPPSSAADDDDSPFRREAFLKVADADAGQPIPGVILRLSVIEGARPYRFGTYRTDARGQTRIDYPPGKFQAWTLDLSAPGYSPVNLTLENEDGVFGPDLPMGMRRQPDPPREP